MVTVSSEYFTFMFPVRFKHIKIWDFDFILIPVRKRGLSEDVRRKLSVLLCQVLGTVFDLKENVVVGYG